MVADASALAPPACPGRPQVRPIAWWPVGLTAGVVAVVHLVLATFDGRWFDEVLMLAIGRHHLDWGSADQPPVAPVLAWLADVLAPDAQWVMRVPAVVATACAVLLAALIARELGGDARAQTLTALAQATGMWSVVFGHWLVPYSLEPAQWLAIGWLLVRWLRVRDDRLLVVLGVVVGVAAQTKFQVLALCAVVLIPVAVLGPRELLARPRFWVGAGIAAVIACPTLIWQAVNGWPQLGMGPVAAAEAGFLYGGRIGVIALTVLGAGLLGIALGGYGLVRLARVPEHRFLAVTTVVLSLLFVLPPGRPYYLAGLYGLVAAAGAVGLQRRREAGRVRWRWVAWPASVLAVALAVACVPTSVALASPVLPERIAAGTAAAYRALPAGQRAHTAIVGGSYIYAAYVDVYSARYDLPQAFSTNRSYGWFAPPPESDDAALYIGDPAELRAFFTEARRLGTVRADDIPGLDGADSSTSLWLLTGRQQPWSVLWPRLHHLDVS